MRSVHRFTMLALGLLAFGCGDDDSDKAVEPDNDATETNVTSFACMNDAECLDDTGPCVIAEGADRGSCAGAADAAEPIACTMPEDCPPGTECEFDDGAEQGTCSELPVDPAASGAAGGTCLAGSDDCNDLGPADGPAGGGAAALCTTDDECPPGQTCQIEPGDDAGLCG